MNNFDYQQGHKMSSRFTLALMLLLGFSSLAYSHDARPVAVTLTEQSTNTYQLSMRIPPSVERDNQPSFVWPQGCSPFSAQSVALNQNLMVCPTGIRDQTLSLDFPLYNPSLATFFRFNSLDDQTRTMMISPTESFWVLEGEPSLLSVARDYLVLGVEHILGGYDHLLFVLGLIVIAKTSKRILLTVTGFTVAHSITLILSALGSIKVPVSPVETTIALSILFLAYEISRKNKNTLTFKYPLIVSFGFGLLHGLGFASALSEVGLVANDIIVSLLFFNLGVEAGQLIFIAVVILAGIFLKRISVQFYKMQGEQGRINLNTDLVLSYVIGVPSAYWLIERLL